MDDEMHPVVQLLLARMDSHPEEFTTDDRRWEYTEIKIADYGNAHERAAVEEKLRLIRLNEAHEWMLDELCNGEERRKKLAAEAKALKTQSYLQQQAYQQQQAYLRQQAYSDAGNHGLLGAISKGLGIK